MSAQTPHGVYMILADGSLKTLHSMCRLKIYNNGLATFHERERSATKKVPKTLRGAQY